MENEEFTVSVDDVGTFTFWRRTMRLEMRIGAEFSRLTEGIEVPSPWFALTANIMSALLVLVKSGPDGWDVMGMDPTDDETYDELVAVHMAMRKQEDDFRRSKKQARQGKRASAGDDAGVLVPAKILAPAD